MGKQNIINLIIFDFDGVLADTFDTFYPLIQDGMKEIGMGISPQQYRDLFKDNVHKGFENLIGDEKKLSRFLEFRSVHYDRYYYANENGAKLFPDAKKFIREINKKFTLAIASSGKQDNIKSLLADNGIENAFRLICADSSHSKVGMLQHILNKVDTEPVCTFLITDTTGDVLAGKSVGLKTIGVTWGFQDRQTLAKANADFLVSNFDELSELLNDLTAQ